VKIQYGLPIGSDTGSDDISELIRRPTLKSHRCVVALAVGYECVDHQRTEKHVGQ
jgi:hypothetical protein